MKTFRKGKEKIVAVCDIDLQKAEKLAKKLSINKVYKNYKDIINDKDVNVISICTPSGLHSAMTVEALKQGKDVILVDPWLCYPSTREIACKRIEEWGATIDEIFFENDPEAALRNVRHRNDGRHVESFIKQTTKHYTIPDGTIKAKIWNPKKEAES